MARSVETIKRKKRIQQLRTFNRQVRQRGLDSLIQKHGKPELRKRAEQVGRHDLLPKINRSKARKDISIEAYQRQWKAELNKYIKVIKRELDKLIVEHGKPETRKLRPQYMEFIKQSKARKRVVKCKS